MVWVELDGKRMNGDCLDLPEKTHREDPHGESGSARALGGRGGRREAMGGRASWDSMSSPFGLIAISTPLVLGEECSRRRRVLVVERMWKSNRRVGHGGFSASWWMLGLLF